MMWMLLGVGTAVYAGSPGASNRDSVGLAELRSHLPQDLRIRIDRTREELRTRRDTLSQLTPAEKIHWMDSLRNEALKRRTSVLENLSPDERGRVENRLHELERQIDQRTKGTQSRDPNQGFRQ